MLKQKLLPKPSDRNEIIVLDEVDGKWRLVVGEAFQKQSEETRDALMTAVDRSDESVPSVEAVNRFHATKFLS